MKTKSKKSASKKTPIKKTVKKPITSEKKRAGRPSKISESAEKELFEKLKAKYEKKSVDSISDNSINEQVIPNIVIRHPEQITQPIVQTPVANIPAPSNHFNVLVNSLNNWLKSNPKTIFTKASAETAAADSQARNPGYIIIARIEPEMRAFCFNISDGKGNVRETEPVKYFS